MPDPDVLAELNAIGLGELTYGTNPGCAGSTHSSGGAPRQCPAAPTHSVEHRYGYRHVKRVRLLVCAHHARLGHDPRPLTAAELEHDERRRAAWRDAWNDRLIAPSRGAAGRRDPGGWCGRPGQTLTGQSDGRSDV